MPQYGFYKGRPCGSTARGEKAWKKTELVAEAQRLGLSTAGTITDLCLRLMATEVTPASTPPASTQSVTAPSASAPSASAPPKPIHVKIKVPNPEARTRAQPLETAGNLDHMNMRVSYHRLQFDVIKSGLQKAIRRGLTSEALSYAIEGDLFSLVEKEGRAKGNRTNLVNRLRIILVEDLFDWNVIQHVAPWFAEWERVRSTDQSRKYLLSIVRVLSEAKKIRLLSDIKVFLMRDIYRQRLGNQYDNIFRENTASLQARSPADKFIALLNDKNPNCLYWSQQMTEHDLWRLLEKYPSRASSVIKTLHQLQAQLPKDHRERTLYTMSAISMILFEDRIDWTPTHLSGLMTDQETADLYCHHLQTALPHGSAGWLPVDVVVDKHTSTGRAHGKTALDFAKEGSWVANEDMRFHFPLLRHIYLEKKIADDDPSLAPPSVSLLVISDGAWNLRIISTVPGRTMAPEAPTLPLLAPIVPQIKVNLDQLKMSDLDADEQGPIYGQKVTATWKPLTYITKNWVYKGPYTGKRANIPAQTVERSRKFKSYGDEGALPKRW